MTATSYEAWAILDRQSDKSLDGPRQRLIGVSYFVSPKPPAHVAGLRTMLFETREEARAWIRDNLGYISKRPDLRAWPHGWLAPRPVKVRVTVEMFP